MWEAINLNGFLIYLLFFLFLFGSEGVERRDGSSDLLKELGLDGNDDRLQRGKQTLENYQSRNSPCWIEAVNELQSKCSEINDIEQSILAMKFADCHFEKSGLKTYNCTDKLTFENCTKSMKREDGSSFLVYTEFFTHVTDICFYLQSEIWRQKTADMINMLSEATGDTIDKLGRSLQNQDLVLQSQQKTLDNQKIIIQREENLKSTLDASTKSAKAAFDEMKHRAVEQEELFSQTFSSVSEGIRTLTTLQTMFLGEFITLQSMAFYIVSLVSCYLFTSSPRTMEARLLLFTLFVVLVFIEKAIANIALQYKEIYGSSTEWIHRNVWLARNAFIGISAFILGYFAFTYKNLNKINNKMLEEMQQKITELHAIERNRQQKMAIAGDDHSSQYIVSNCDKDTLHADPSTCHTPVNYKSSELLQESSSGQSIFAMSDISDEDTVDSKVGIRGALKVNKENSTLSADGCDSEGEEQQKVKKFSIKNFIKKSSKPKKSISVDTVQHANTNKTSNDAYNSRYNLRSRSTTPLNSSHLSSLFVQNTSERLEKTTKILDVKKQMKAMDSAGLFSSDDEY